MGGIGLWLEPVGTVDGWRRWSLDGGSSELLVEDSEWDGGCLDAGLSDGGCLGSGCSDGSLSDGGWSSVGRFGEGRLGGDLRSRSGPTSALAGETRSGPTPAPPVREVSVTSGSGQ